MKEEFKQCIEGYWVSNNGYVIDIDSNIIKSFKKVGGHPVVYLSNESAFKHAKGDKVCYYVHRLVAEAFISNPNSLTDILHLDGDKTNNVVTNLQRCTHQELISYKVPSKTKKKHWRSGVVTSEETKAKQRASIAGTKHPMFTGYYIQTVLKGKETIVRRYESSTIAGKAAGVSYKSVIRWSKTGKNGWSFEPVGGVVDKAMSDDATTQDRLNVFSEIVNKPRSIGFSTAVVPPHISSSQSFDTHQSKPLRREEENSDTYIPRASEAYKGISSKSGDFLFIDPIDPPSHSRHSEASVPYPPRSVGDNNAVDPEEHLMSDKGVHIPDPNKRFSEPPPNLSDDDDELVGDYFK